MTPYLPPADRRLEIAVLGGGLSGLSAAYWLGEFLPGSGITVFEGKPACGGMVSSTRINGYLTESGPLAFPYAGTATGDLLDRAGLSDSLMASGSGKGLGLWDGDRLFPFPRTARSALANRVLSLKGLLRLLMEPFIRTSRKVPDETIRDFFLRRTGREFFERLVDPFAACILAGDPGSLSLRSNMPGLEEMERTWGSIAMGKWRKRREAGGPKAGKPRLPAMVTTREGCAGMIRGLEDHLRARGVAFRCSHKIDALHRLERFRLEWTAGGIQGNGMFDGVVTCLPARAMADMGGDFPESVLDFFAGIPYSPAALVHMALPDPVPSGDPKAFRGDGFVPQSRAGEKFLSCFFPSRMAAGRCPEGQELVRVILGGARDGIPEAPAEPEALRRAGEMSRKILGRGNPVFGNYLLHERGLPLLVAGHAEKTAAMREWLTRCAPGLFVAGTGIQGAGVENAVLSGKRAAEQAAAYLAG